jgi:hypothetical protein
MFAGLLQRTCENSTHAHVRIFARDPSANSRVTDVAAQELPHPLRRHADLYERLYFHELAERERLVSRLQLTLTLLVALGGGFAVLLQS